MCDRCSNCPKLERRIAKLEKAINKALRVLEMLERFLTQVVYQSQAVISHHSGVPRGQWAYHRGRLEIAEHVLVYIRLLVNALTEVLF